MTLAAGDLTTQSRLALWIPNAPSPPNPLLQMLISSVTAMIYNKLNRSRLFSRSYTRVFDGVGNYQIVLPDWPVTSIASVQMGAALIKPFPLPTPSNGFVTGAGYGYRFAPWQQSLPGDPAVLEFVNGWWCQGVQNIKIVYTAGYLISGEAQTVPTGGGNVTVAQPLGIWCGDAGVTYANGTPLVAVAPGTAPTQGQYAPPSATDPNITLSSIGQYTFAAADANQGVLISYSFVPADLEDACLQMVAERYSYRNRVGESQKGLGGQENIRYLRGGSEAGLRGISKVGNTWFVNIPPEVDALISPYVSTLPPVIGAPL